MPFVPFPAVWALIALHMALHVTLHMAIMIRTVIRVIAVVVLNPRQCRTDQFAIGEVILLIQRLGRSLIHSVFHSGGTPKHTHARECQLFSGPLKMYLRRREI